MPCNLTHSLKKNVVETPRLLQSKEWHPHLKNCPDCREEAKSFDQSLELYLHVKNTAEGRFPEIQAWEHVSEKIARLQPGFLQRYKSLAIAAVAALLVGVSLFWGQFPFSYAPEDTTASIPAHYPVEEAVMNQPFGPPSAETRFVWTEQHFGISIQNKEEGNYPKISIGTRLSKDFAHTPQTDLSSGLAYLLPREKTSRLHSP